MLLMMLSAATLIVGLITFGLFEDVIKSNNYAYFGLYCLIWLLLLTEFGKLIQFKNAESSLKNPFAR